MGEIRTLSLGSSVPSPSPGLAPPPGISPAAAHPHPGSPKHRSFHASPWERPISPGHLSVCFLVAHSFHASRWKLPAKAGPAICSHSQWPWQVSLRLASGAHVQK